MKKTTNKIWFSKMTILFAIIQLLIPLIFGTSFAKVNFGYFIITSIVVTLLINWNIWWLEKKDKILLANRYLTDAPITFQVLKFTIGIFVSMVIVLINMIIPINGIKDQMVGIIISWYFVPLIMVFVSVAMVDVSKQDAVTINGKVRKLPLFIMKLSFIFFDYNQNGKIKWGFKPIINTVAFFLMLSIVALFYVGKLFV